MDKNVKNPTFPSIDEDMGEWEPLGTAGWDVEMAQLFG